MTPAEATSIGPAAADPSDVRSWARIPSRAELVEQRALRDSRSKRVTLYGFRGPSGRTVEVVVKSCAPDTFPALERECALLRLLGDARGGGWGTAYAVPRVLRLVEERRLAVLQRVDGTPPLDLGRGAPASGRGSEAAACGRCGRWLAAFGATARGLELAPCRSADGRTPPATVLAAELASVEQGLATLAAEAAAAVEGARVHGPGVVHGDYHPCNVLVGARAVFGLDLERSHDGDPVEDCGSFIGRARVMALYAGRDPATLERALASFVEEYASRAGQGPALEARIGAATVRAVLESVHFALYLGRNNPPAVQARSRAIPWRALLERALAEASGPRGRAT